MAIAIVIEEGAAGTPSGFGVDETRFASDIFKGTVSQIAVELVLPEVSAEEVVVAVVVIVTDADSIGPSNGFESCLLCNIGEGTVAIVLIESIGFAERRALEAGTTEEKDFDPAKIVVVK